MWTKIADWADKIIEGFHIDWNSTYFFPYSSLGVYLKWVLNVLILGIVESFTIKSPQKPPNNADLQRVMNVNLNPECKHQITLPLTVYRINRHSLIGLTLYWYSADQNSIINWVFSGTKKHLEHANCCESLYQKMNWLAEVSLERWWTLAAYK